MEAIKCVEVCKTVRNRHAQKIGQIDKKLKKLMDEPVAGKNLPNVSKHIEDLCVARAKSVEIVNQLNQVL